MANKNMTQDKELAEHLLKKMDKLLKKQGQLLKELQAEFTTEKFREMNILENKILCCKNRMTGKFKDARGEFELKTNYYDCEITLK